MECQSVRSLEEVLTPKQVHHVLNQAVGGDWRLLSSEIKPATIGLSGFLGDHFRVTLRVKINEFVKNVHIFVKSMPLDNKPKASFIDENHYYRREMLMFQLFDELRAAGEPNPWCAKAYICTDNVVVMPDLLHLGYSQRPQLDYLDLKHTLVTTASIARFHAAFANYETKKTLSGHKSFFKEHAHLLKEATFFDSLWLRAAAKLTSNFLAAFSDKCDQYPWNLEQILAKLYIEACESLTENSNFNVVIHKDLWINNIMFKYEDKVPTDALLIDFQCIRYGPPAFDLMIFLYLNSSRSFREKYEEVIFRHYYVIFWEHLETATKERLRGSGYDYNDFVSWCEKSRMFSLLEAIGIFPYVLMRPDLAQKTFDDPETFMKYCNEDRTAPVVAHAKECEHYKQRTLEVSEEFVERYILKTP